MIHIIYLFDQYILDVMMFHVNCSIFHYRQRYSFLVTLIFFLEAEKLALHSDVAELLGGIHFCKCKCV